MNCRIKALHDATGTPRVKMLKQRRRLMLRATEVSNDEGNDQDTTGARVLGNTSSASTSMSLSMADIFDTRSIDGNEF